MYSCSWKKRILRTRSVETRLAVTLATVPVGNSMRACAISTLSVITGMPTALRSDDRRVHQRKQNIEVVNHHVVHHVDIQAARRENAQAVDFEKQRPRDDFLHRGDGGIESLDVPDLQDAAGTLARKQSDCSASSSEAAIGFSTSTSMPASSRWQPTRACSLVGTATLTASTPAAASASRSRITSRAEFCGDLASALAIGVNNTDEFSAFEFAPHANVVPAEFSGADHGNANGFLGHAFVFASTESSANA